MKTILWSLLLLASDLLGGFSLAVAGHAKALPAANVQQLIEQLGDDQYVQRQRAEKQLLERGAEAFAELQAATSNADLEIAIRAKYLLTQIKIDWVRESDPPIVRSIMAHYGELSQANRLAIIGKLSKLEHEQGFGALCRITRFESSDLSARRYAALAILEKGLLPAARAPAAATKLTKELGDSDGIPINWVRVYADQLHSRQQIDPRWLTVIDEEIELLADKSNETSQTQLLTLLDSYLEICDQLSDAEAIMAGLQRRIELGNSRGEVTNLRIYSAITWLTDHKQWEALSLLEDRYADEIKNQRLLLYLVAVARSKQGRSADAEEVAQQAFQLEASSSPFTATNAQERNQCALLLGEFGRHDWAEREWRYIIDTEDVTDIESLKARQSLGLFVLHDRLEHKAGADLLTETIDAIDANAAVKQRYRTDPRSWGQLVRARSNREYFLAFHFQTSDTEKQRQHLEQAYKLNSSNPDILIAMYRIKDSSESYRKRTQSRITKSLRAAETGIKKSKTDPNWYNHWAWLVSNTEGDFEKAVRYSQRSLKLSPGSASYLDTLGRCYYAAGDLENAIKVQREAAVKHPHLRVIQRQLHFFEDELRKRQGGEAEVSQ